MTAGTPVRGVARLLQPPVDTCPATESEVNGWMWFQTPSALCLTTDGGGALRAIDYPTAVAIVSTVEVGAVDALPPPRRCAAYTDHPFAEPILRGLVPTVEPKMAPGVAYRVEVFTAGVLDFVTLNLVVAMDNANVPVLATVVHVRGHTTFVTSPMWLSLFAREQSRLTVLRHIDHLNRHGLSVVGDTATAAQVVNAVARSTTLAIDESVWEAITKGWADADLPSIEFAPASLRVNELHASVAPTERYSGKPMHTLRATREWWTAPDPPSPCSAPESPIPAPKRRAAAAAAAPPPSPAEAWDETDVLTSSRDIKGMAAATATELAALCTPGRVGKVVSVAMSTAATLAADFLNDVLCSYPLILDHPGWYEVCEGLNTDSMTDELRAIMLSFSAGTPERARIEKFLIERFDITL